jgi:hypothetical protein
MLCLVSWDIVTRPLILGGFGVPNLYFQSWALQAMWLWLEKTDTNKPWHGLKLPVPVQVRKFFQSSVVTVVGNGNRTLFWSDRWLDGGCIKDFAPAVVSKFGKNIVSTRTVAQAIENCHWNSDILTPLSWVGIQQFLLLWDAVRRVVLAQEVDKHIWLHTSSGQFSTKSCYKAFFIGSINFEPWKRLWKSWAPPKCKFFLWLAIRNKCRTSDRLERRGLDHPESCLLCDQSQETIQHILCTCVFARQFWHTIVLPLGFGNLSLSGDEISFADWWRKVCKRIHKSKRKGMNSVIILGAWYLWIHRNKAVFDGENPSLGIIKCVLSMGWCVELRLELNILRI